MDVKSVAVIGAGAAGAITAAALKAESYFERIKVFERREAAGGTWIYDADPGAKHPIFPGKLPVDVDRPLEIPPELPTITQPSKRERWTTTPIYSTLTTNVPDIAMCFSDKRFAYGPFVPHYIARQYVESYFAAHHTDDFLELNTTVEDLSMVLDSENKKKQDWNLTLRKYDPVRRVDIWWEERFDAVVLANGHYAVPYVPQVQGLENYLLKYPGRVLHSKFYRSPDLFAGKRIVVVGNSASGRDVSLDVLKTARLPVVISQRSKSRWDGDQPPEGIEWKPIIKEFGTDGRITFNDESYLDDVDIVVYCTGYKTSFPFWNEKANGRALWDYAENRLRGCYWHTFLRDFPTIALVGVPRTLTFRSFEYQAIAIARIWSNRNSTALPSLRDQEEWEKARAKRTRSEGKKFHDIPWDNGETTEYFDFLFKIAGLGTIHGAGRVPPVLGKDMVWAIEHLRKYPDPPQRDNQCIEAEGEWVVVKSSRQDSLAFL
ncbi:uncharacterized protein B0I36DRAFT_394475 [Microdochium trichocladiopsis]|uniref:Thiol-specific monooxygenase n=1 Tax=Microdochium trichocladiopsis TaxID=1682393 RepID=A0A9P8XTC7_9PEZI|nr:uncharacterized protein B0I36DRAFT_394475 [Microdochium trichocladiopsis]KAH7017960.1 hypothetical protein B0I36DRAFT_394475 [Microdochium trichocladiopsis]